MIKVTLTPAVVGYRGAWFRVLMIALWRLRLCFFFGRKVYLGRDKPADGDYSKVSYGNRRALPFLKLDWRWVNHGK